MRRLFLALAATVCLATFGPADQARADGAFLTVTGNVAETNQSAFDPFSDGLFNGLQIEFDKAYAFSREDLLKLPQQTLRAKYPNWPVELEFRGPNLKAVLAAATADGDMVVVRAVDGYAPEFKMTDIQTGKFVLALEVDDRPLDIGGRGPVWLVFPQNSFEDQPEDDGGLAWAVFHIEVF
jgi:hypothetical protein